MLTRYHDDPAAARPFTVLPAIDLRGGRVVRLEQGDFERETSFSDDPAGVAVAFADAGARWLHVVDLDGARTGVPAHGAAIAAIVDAVGERVAVEVAGGLRTAPAVAAVLDAGAARAVIGTAALSNPGFAAGLVTHHGAGSIAVAIDVRDGLAVGHGWSPGQIGVDAATAMIELRGAGVTTFEVTAIDRDGLLRGPDLSLYRRMLDLGVGDVIASAGVASVADIRALREAGCVGAIIGRALYDGRLSLADAVEA